MSGVATDDPNRGPKITDPDLARRLAAIMRTLAEAREVATNREAER